MEDLGPGRHRSVVKQAAEADGSERDTGCRMPSRPQHIGTGHEIGQARQAVDRLSQPAVMEGLAVGAAEGKHSYQDGTEMDDDRADLRARILRTAIVVLVVAYAWWAVARPAFSSSATLAVLTAGAAAVALGALDRRGPGRPVQATKVARWALLAGALGAWQLVAYLQQPRDDHPTLSSLTNALLDSHAARAVAFVLWLAAARELARR